MPLQILIEKRHNDRSILKCIREDGSNTYSKLYPNLEIHDIAHYVVEQELGFRHAFYGLLSQGYAIDDFQLPKEERPLELRPSHLHPEALITEHLVNVLQVDYGNPDMSAQDILKTLGQILKENNLPFPSQMDLECLERIRQALKSYMCDWKTLKPGSCLKLSFEIKPG